MGPSQCGFNGVAAGRNVGGGFLTRSVTLMAVLMFMGIACISTPAKGDEGGVGFWLPGLFGSLAAAPQVPGWSLGMIYIHDSVSAGGNVATARAITIGQFNPILRQTLNASLNATSDIAVVSAFGDLFPQFVLRWNAGVNNWTIYTTGDIPVGAYDSARPANLGLGHGAVDAGAGYTFFDQKTGYEFSAVASVTYNFINPSTDYQNGVDFHLDGEHPSS